MRSSHGAAAVLPSGGWSRFSARLLRAPSVAGTSRGFRGLVDAGAVSDGIPIVGFIYVLVVAFGGSASPSRCNWARAMLLWQIIAIILVVVFIALGGWALFESQGSY